MWVSAAMAQNLGIRTAQEQLAAARRTVKARRSGHLPTIDATVTQVHSVTGSPNFFGADTTDQTVWGLQLNLPLYNGGIVRSRAKEAVALKETSARTIVESAAHSYPRHTQLVSRCIDRRHPGKSQTQGDQIITIGLGCDRDRIRSRDTQHRRCSAGTTKTVFLTV